MRQICQVHIIILACFLLASDSKQDSVGKVGKIGLDFQLACKQKPGFYWNEENTSCLACTKCHPLGLVTLLGCSPTKDALCGTMQDFKKQMEEQILRRGRNNHRKDQFKVASNDEEDSQDKKTDVEEDEVFGKTVQFSAEKERKRATHKIRQRVKNQSQRKKEFLRQLQKEENIGRNFDKMSSEDDFGSFSFGDLEGQVKFSDDLTSTGENKIRSGNLHEDLRQIEKELLNGGLIHEGTDKLEKDTSTDKKRGKIFIQSASISTTILTTSTTEETSTTTPTTGTSQASRLNHEDLFTTKATTSTTPPPPTTSPIIQPDWPLFDYNVIGTDEEENVDDGEDEQPPSENIDETDRIKFIPSTSFDNFGSEDDKVFGAVIKNPTDDENDQRTVPDEFGLLSRILYKNERRSFQHEDQAEVEIPNLDLTHSFIILGFIIGFSLVFGVGIIFSKLIHNKSIKQLDNGATFVGESNLLTTKIKQFQMNATNCLMESPRSPKLSSRTVVASSLEDGPPIIITEPCQLPIHGISISGAGCSSPSTHAFFVNKNGKTVLKSIRELPV